MINNKINNMNNINVCTNWIKQTARLTHPICLYQVVTLTGVLFNICVKIIVTKVLKKYIGKQHGNYGHHH